jgi:hypothetical protein
MLRAGWSWWPTGGVGAPTGDVGAPTGGIGAPARVEPGRCCRRELTRKSRHLPKTRARGPQQRDCAAHDAKIASFSGEAAAGPPRHAQCCRQAAGVAR